MSAETRLDTFDGLPTPRDHSESMRPTELTEELEQRIFDLIASGTPFYRLGKETGGLPSQTVLLRWRRENPEFRALLEEADRVRRRTMADEAAVELFRALTNLDEWRVSSSGDEEDGKSSRFDKFGAQYFETKVAGLERFMARMDPERYGDTPNILISERHGPRTVEHQPRLIEALDMQRVIDGYKAASDTTNTR